MTSIWRQNDLGYCRSGVYTWRKKPLCLSIQISIISRMPEELKIRLIQAFLRIIELITWLHNGNKRVARRLIPTFSGARGDFFTWSAKFLKHIRARAQISLSVRAINTASVSSFSELNDFPVRINTATFIREEGDTQKEFFSFLLMTRTNVSPLERILENFRKLTRIKLHLCTRSLV